MVMRVDMNDAECRRISEMLDKRLLLVTGKGGVGRTSVAAGLATAAARSGKRVLLAEFSESYGDYSPLARLFGIDEFPAEPVEVAAGVRACVLHAWTGHRLFFQSIMPIKAIVRAALKSKALAFLLDAAPSLHEMGSFYYLLCLLRETRAGTNEPEHELIVIDMPATGHTLALTSLPDVLLNLMPVGPIANSMRAGQAYVNDPAKSNALVVTLPERLPVTECLELLEGLKKTQVPVGGVIVNRFRKDVFTADEREVLDRVLDAVLLRGATRYYQLSESQQALERLRDSTDVPIAVLPEMSARGSAFLPSIAAALGRPGDAI